MLLINYKHIKKRILEISDGTLKIQAKKVGDGQEKGDYTSSRVNTKYAYKYGRIEVSLKLPEKGERTDLG